ncbi:MAG: hypothetical protein ABI983_00220 [Acidobacteriota bacterium]
MKTDGPQRGSSVRYVAGLVILVAALITLPAGFLQMVYALEHGGYGTSSNTMAFMTLGVGGGLLGLGIALLIWELSVRHNIRH